MLPQYKFLTEDTSADTVTICGRHYFGVGLDSDMLFIRDRACFSGALNNKVGEHQYLRAD
jgi:hypothetical protein